MTERSQNFDVLRRHDFRRLFLARAISRLGDDVAPVAVAFAIIGRHGSASGLGLVLMAKVLSQLLFGLIGGTLADRRSRRTLMIASDLTRCASQATFAVLVISNSGSLATFVALQTVNGAASAFFMPASSGAVPETVERDQLQGANALLGLARSTSGVIGPLTSGLLVASVGAGWALAVDAGTFALSAMFLAGLRLSTIHAEHRAFRTDFAEGFRAVTTRTWLWASLLVGAIYHLAFFGPLMVLGPFVAARALGGASGWAIALSAMSAGSILGGFLVLRITPRRPLVLANASLLGCFPVLLALALPTGLPVIVLAQLAAGAALSVYDALWSTTLQQQVPGELLGRVSSFDYIVSTALWPLGLAIAGPAAAAFGTSATLAVAAATVATTAILAVAARSMRMLEQAAPTPNLA